MKTIIVLGIPGCGKTSIVELALKRLKKYEIVTFGTLMFQILKEKKIVKTRDEMRKLSNSIQIDVQKEAAQKIADLAKNKNIIVDTHCSIKTPKGFIVGLPEYILKKINPDHIILVESDSEEIFERRMKDDTRKRDNDSTDKIQLHQEINRSLALSFCTLTNAVFSIVKNDTGKLMAGSRELAEIIEM
ncbi:MAG: adenylate kinase [Candidatus Aenigmarchaeota archaeon]|nr:adenylate kinase [Candidatus Aenigmarchaeota archaeon]